MVGNKAKKAIAAALSGAMVLSAAAPAIAGVQLDSGWYRINGDHKEDYTLMLDADKSVSGSISGTEDVKGVDRYDTAFDAIDYNAKNDVWKPGTVNKIILASGTSQADSLVAAGLNEITTGGQGTEAKTYTVPVMITDGNNLSTPARRAIKAYYDAVKKGNVVDPTSEKGDCFNKFTVEIVGGEAAISSKVEDQIKDIADDDEGTKIDEIKIKRFAGADRVATSLEVAKKNAKYLTDEEGKKVIYVANGTAWPDALSVSSLAYGSGNAILLTGADGKLSADQLAYLLDVSKSVEVNVIGGPASPSMQQLFDAGFERARVHHIAGNDRYETSAAVIEDAVETLTLIARLNNQYATGFETLAVANGEEGHWADALVGGPFVGANGGVLALVNNLDNVVALKEAYKYQMKKSDGAPKEKSYIIGGEAAISEDFADMLQDEFPTATLN